MKKTKIVVPALAVLLLSTAASVSGTVAWFSMNTSINVTGMTVTTKVSSNLQISATNDESLFSNSDLPQTRSALLEPASSVNGVSFFYTTNAKSNGDANAENYPAYAEATALHQTQKDATGKTSYDENFNSTYGFTTYDAAAGTGEVAFAYLDYSFYLKANIIGSGQKIVMDRCNILYNDGELDEEWSWRVALFAHQVDANTPEADSTTAAAGNLKTILDFENSRNQNEVISQVLPVGAIESGWFTDPQLITAASGNADGKTTYYKASAEKDSPKAVSANNAAPTAVTYGSEAVVASGVEGSKIYKVVVRLWLEGEDVGCTSDTFADLQEDDYSLKISFKLGTEDGTREITSDDALDFTQH